MTTRLAIWPFILALALGTTVRATYYQPQLEQVPIERLIRNLSDMAASEPQNAALRLHLARAHAMAYANRGAAVRVIRRGQVQGWQGLPWFGPPFAANLPFAPVASGFSTPPGDAEKAHLSLAITEYEQALRLDPLNSVSRLGYGWCLDQAGNKAGAMEAFRRVISEVWPAEQSVRGIRGFQAVGGPGFVTAEAADYLIPLLDPVKDAAEIARLRGYAAELNSRPRSVTPLAIPLVDHLNLPRLVDRSARVRFDADGSGLDREWSWISKDAGWLVYDRLGAGQITSALQLFGNVTFWMFWENGYEALRALDDNGDGRLAGGELAHLAIWRDSNSNGTSEAGEVKPLAEWGIVQLSTAYEPEDEGDVFIASSRAGVTFADGSTRATYDVLLHRK